MPFCIESYGFEGPGHQVGATWATWAPQSSVHRVHAENGRKKNAPKSAPKVPQGAPKGLLWDTFLDENGALGPLGSSGFPQGVPGGSPGPPGRQNGTKMIKKAMKIRISI